MSRLTVYGSGLPSGGAAGQSLMRDGNGNAVWGLPLTSLNFPVIGSTYFTATDHGLGTVGGSGIALATGTLYVTPFMIPANYTHLTAVYVNITVASAAGGTAQFGLFTLDASATATLVATLGTIATTGTGVAGVTGLNQAVSLNGWYAIGTVVNQAVTVTQHNSGSKGVGANNWWADTNVGLTQSAAYGAFAASYSGLIGKNGSVGIGLKGA